MMDEFIRAALSHLGQRLYMRFKRSFTCTQRICVYDYCPIGSAHPDFLPKYDDMTFDFEKYDNFVDIDA